MSEYKAIPEAEDCSPTPRTTGFTNGDEVLAQLHYPKEYKSQESVRERPSSGVCGEWYERPLLQLLEVGSRQDKYGNIINRLQEDQSEVPAKMHLDMCLSRFSRTPSSAGPTLSVLATDFLWYTALWPLIFVTSVPGFGQSVCSGLWASFACVTQDVIFCDFVCVFFVFSSYSRLVLLET